MNKKILLAAFVMMVFPKMIFALPMNEFPASPWTEEKTYLDKTLGKLGFGIMNTVGGWTALSSEYREKHEDSFASAALRSVLRAVTNTGGGLLNVATFPFPFDVRLPGGGASFE